tara:strand:- start:93 stop:416 length:324 start_codon:yes stop_codon:yes gene_type:complete
MRLTMCDVEPLLHIFRDPKKEIHIDPLYIDSDGLEVISKLSLSRETANGVLYAKFKKVSAHFEIVDKAPRMIGFGGRKKSCKRWICLARMRNNNPPDHAHSRLIRIR